jgi:hypothetical protein
LSDSSRTARPQLSGSLHSRCCYQGRARSHVHGSSFPWPLSNGLAATEVFWRLSRSFWSFIELLFIKLYSIDSPVQMAQLEAELPKIYFEKGFLKGSLSPWWSAGCLLRSRFTGESPSNVTNTQRPWVFSLPNTSFQMLGGMPGRTHGCYLFVKQRHEL